MPVKTVEARVLLGWMERDQAIEYLQKECVFDPPLTNQQAEAIWLPYYDAVKALGPVRNCAAAPRHPLNASEQQTATKLLTFFRRLPSGAPTLVDVVKVDPAKLVVHQLYVVLDRSQGYRKSISTPVGWAQMCLDPAVPAQRSIFLRGCPGGVEYDVPHMEFFASFQQHPIVTPDGSKTIALCVFPQENAKYVSICDFQGRTLLWAGYHRTFARMVITADDAIARSLPMVLTTDAAHLLSPTSPNHGLRDMVTGPTPPLFGDFLDGRFFMTLKLRKRKYLLRVTSQVVPIDEAP